jgi:hypothetical protein
MQSDRKTKIPQPVRIILLGTVDKVKNMRDQFQDQEPDSMPEQLDPDAQENQPPIQR